MLVSPQKLLIIQNPNSLCMEPNSKLLENSQQSPNNAFWNKIDKKKLIQLIFGVVGIITTFSISSIFVELLVKHKYLNRFTGKQELCRDYYGYNFFHSFYVWAMGNIILILFIRKRGAGREERENERVPWKYVILCGCTMIAGNIATMNAVHQTSFAVITVFKACSVLSVILVGVFCSRVRDQRLKLGRQKMLAAILITGCILVFQLFDPETRDRSLQAQFLGILFLMVSVSADGFYPDFQAKMKTQNRQLEPLAMMVKIHLIMFTLSLVLELVTWNLISYLVFMYEHPLYIGHLAAQISCSFIGQIFVYRMIKQFKQHVVPFTVTTRKIMSVFWSILFFGHSTNWIQIVSIFGLLAVVCWEFKVQVSKDPTKLLQKNEQATMDAVNKQIIGAEQNLNDSLLTSTASEYDIQTKELQQHPSPKSSSKPASKNDQVDLYAQK